MGMLGNIVIVGDFLPPDLRVLNAFVGVGLIPLERVSLSILLI